MTECFFNTIYKGGCQEMCLIKWPHKSKIGFFFSPLLEVQSFIMSKNILFNPLKDLVLMWFLDKPRKTNN